MKQAIIIFAKNLIYGQVKTRLAATIGNDSALVIYKRLLQHTESTTKNLPVDKIVFYSTSIEEQDIWNNEVFKKQIQSGNDLGERMQNAFRYAFQHGCMEAVIIGTDCVELTSGIIMNAFASLENNDIVIGPAKDGGYYLLAMKHMHHLLFKNINWSTDKVLKKTLSVCTQLSLTVYLLPELSDVDKEHDLNEEQKIMIQINPAKHD
jgi:rSAM/selenodomain-associated transferase 1